MALRKLDKDSYSSFWTFRLHIFCEEKFDMNEESMYTYSGRKLISSSQGFHAGLPTEHTERLLAIKYCIVKKIEEKWMFR